MQAKYIIGFLIVLVVIVGGVFAFSGGETAQAPSETPDNVSDTTNNEPAGDGSPDTAPGGTDNQQTDSENGTSDDTTSDDGDASSDTDGGTTSPAATITYTNDGFSPETITIQQGQAVQFVNESSREVWPASAVHPTHTVYPESSADDCLGSSFDACEGLANGETWSFTFTETGEWKYHDHLRASETGTIIVE